MNFLNLGFSGGIIIAGLVVWALILVLLNKGFIKAMDLAGYDVLQGGRDLLFWVSMALWILPAVWMATTLFVVHGPRLSEDTALPPMQLDEPLAAKTNLAPPVQKDQSRVEQTRKLGDDTKTD